MRSRLIGHLRPGQAQFAQLLNIELGVDPCAVGALVTKQLADLGKAGARTQQVGRKAVTEEVGAVVRITMNARPLEGLLRDHRDGAAGGKADVRSKHSQK
ncbi:hypothetical protein MESS4_330052 [Mesorhizobium sp. STM 4661]|nr:hypothetical protein MESS4_330052 [Mesorhizobium sp. STM 4661]